MILVAIHKTMRSAVEYHRLYIPFKNMDVLFEDNIEAVTAQYLKDNDIQVVWFNRNISPTLYNPDPLFRLLRHMGIKIVCDIDDYWELNFGHVLYNVMIKGNLKNSQISQIKASDYVCVTHEFLANKVHKELGVSRHRIIIAPNGIDPTEPQYDQTFSYDLTKIFWQGSVTHHDDLKQMAKAFNNLGLKIFIAGYQRESYTEKNGKKYYHWEETGNLFENKQWIPFAEVDDYMKFYQNKGICVIPLEKNKFTVCKSNLKMLEAGWAKKPVVVSGIHPYTTIGKDLKNCMFAYSERAWSYSLRYLLDNPNFAEDIRERLHEDVRDNYLINKCNESRLNLIDKICH